MNSEEIMNPSQKEENKNYFIVGKIINYKVEGNCLYLVFGKTEIALVFLNADIIRIVMDKSENPDLQSSAAVIDHKLKCENFSVEEREDMLVVKTQALKIIINKNRFALRFYDLEDRLIHSDYSQQALGWNKDEIRAWKRVENGERFYGLGEKTGFLDKRGKKYTMWNTDTFEPHVYSTDPMYKSIPFFVGFNNGCTYGIYFDNTYKSHFDFDTKDKDYFSFWAEGGKMDYYFINGPEIKKVITRYTQLTGRPSLPPKWALGYHQSRYSYETEEEVMEIAQKFREQDIPCDAIHLDIHYMDGFRVFTWDENRFKNPGKMISSLENHGFKLVNIVDPGVKRDPEYEVYQEGVKKDYFCKYLKGDIYIGEVWPGEAVFPDFTQQKVRKWWGDLHKEFLAQGIKGIWNDMNEPADFNETSTMDEKVIHNNDGDFGTHRRFHNIYGLLENKATYKAMKNQTGERPFILTRAAFAGIQRYAAVWTGDNRSFWEHLKLSMPMLMNLGMSGICFAGTDVGGFADDVNAELLVRWTQLGAFMPFFRNHCAINKFRQEPWVFGEKYKKIIKNYIQLRYKFITHIYNLFYRASQTGLPVMRPLVLEYPEDNNTYNLYDQFMIGKNILVAPVYQPDRDRRMVYLPEGDWFEFFSGEKYEGNSYIIADASLDTLPLYIKGGSIIPLNSVYNYIEEEPEELEINIYLSEKVDNGEYVFYEDDGLTFAYKEGEYNLIRFYYQIVEKEICFKVEKKYKGCTSSYTRYILKLKNVKEEPEYLSVNGQKIKKWEYKPKEDELKVIISVD